MEKIFGRVCHTFHENKTENHAAESRERNIYNRKKLKYMFKFYIFIKLKVRNEKSCYRVRFFN